MSETSLVEKREGRGVWPTREFMARFGGARRGSGCSFAGDLLL